jgi:uncharacterized membrane protein YcaP (DUF421 family)
MSIVGSAVFLAAIATRTAIVLLALFAGLRLLGKRSIGEMNIYDLLLILMVANAVQNSMTQGIGPLLVAFVAGATLLLVGWSLSELFVRRPCSSAVSSEPQRWWYTTAGWSNVCCVASA